MTGRVVVEPFSRAVPVTKSDTTLIAPSRGIMASGGTELAIAFQDGSTVILTNITPIHLPSVSSKGIGYRNHSNRYYRILLRR